MPFPPICIFLERRKRFVFRNLTKTIREYLFNVNFEKNFQSSHQTNVYTKRFKRQIGENDILRKKAETLIVT